jgi:hypothetical protein
LVRFLPFPGEEKRNGRSFIFFLGGGCMVVFYFFSLSLFSFFLFSYLRFESNFILFFLVSLSAFAFGLHLGEEEESRPADQQTSSSRSSRIESRKPTY